MEELKMSILPLMEEQEAREITNQIKNNLSNTRVLLLAMYEREGWKALSYGSWREYGMQEFGYSESRVYELMNAARVENNISAVAENSAIPERQLRPLSTLEPEQQREAWGRAQEIAGDRKLIAKDVQQAVDELHKEPQFYETTNARQEVAVTMFSSESNEYYTPAAYTNAARELMGSIDLDPASCETAQQTIQATTYYTQDDDGLSHAWIGRVWLNPPYGKIGNESSQGYWGQRLIAEYKAGNVIEGVLLVRAGVGYEWFERLWDELPVCFARARLSFVREDGNDDGQSKQGTALFYVGDNVNGFVSTFRHFGRIILPENQL